MHFASSFQVVNLSIMTILTSFELPIGQVEKQYQRLDISSFDFHKRKIGFLVVVCL